MSHFATRQAFSIRRERTESQAASGCWTGSHFATRQACFEPAAPAAARGLVAALILVVFLQGCGLFQPATYATFGITGTAFEEMADGNTGVVLFSLIVLPLTLAFDTVLLLPYAIPRDIYSMATAEEEEVETESGTAESTHHRPGAVGERRED